MTTLTINEKICIERELNVTNQKHNFEELLTCFDIKETCKWIEDNKFLRVCLQFPDDLLYTSTKIYEEIKKKVDVDLHILGDTSYASCCVDSVAAMHVQADAVVHYGYSCFTKTNIPVFTVLPKRQIDVETTMMTLPSHFSTDVKICLFYDAEFEHCKDKLAECFHTHYAGGYIAYLEMEDKPNKMHARVVKDKNGVELPMETLKDCNCVYLGSRGQTLFNYSISIEAKNWYLFDPQTNSGENIDETAWFRRRRFLVEKCKDAEVVGILVCKLGDQTNAIINRMRQLCKVNGKRGQIVHVGKPNDAKLANFHDINIYVMIACPENDLYSNRDFYKPIVYPYELDVALNSNREPYFKNHVTDYVELLQGGRSYCDIEQTQETDVSLITGKIRVSKIKAEIGIGTDLELKQNWALENIGQSLQDRSWKGLEQKLGETEVKKVEDGRKGIPMQYDNEII